MRFLLDMGLAQSTASYLRSRGHDAVHLRVQGLQSLADQEIVELARTEARIVVTHDLDFGRIVALAGAKTPSVITFRLSDMRPNRVNLVIGRVLERSASALESGALISVTDRGVRVRLLTAR
jgi:predicted nuclease of predicted toxin-antitoxin system